LIIRNLYIKKTGPEKTRFFMVQLSDAWIASPNQREKPGGIREAKGDPPLAIAQTCGAGQA
jgi:hypothetical protein